MSSPAQPILPIPPPGADLYLFRLYEAIYNELIRGNLRLDTLHLLGTAAQRPAATGGRQFFWQTDGTPHLEFDNGTWSNV